MAFPLAAALPAIISGVSALVGGAMSNKAASDSQQRSIDAQRGLQNMLLNGGDVMARKAKQAGLSPAFALGNASTPSASAPSAQFAPYDFSGFQQSLSGISQRELQRQQKKVAQAQEKEVSANAEIAEEKAKQEQMRTQDMSAQRRAFEETSNVIDPETGELIVTQSPKLTGAYGASLGELEKAEMLLKKQGFDVQSLKYEIDEGVYNRQKSDEKVLSAIAQLPVANIEQLQAHAKELLAASRQHDSQALLNESQKALVDIEKLFTEARYNEYKSGSVDSLFKNFSIENFFKFFLRNLLDIVHVGVGKRF